MSSRRLNLVLAVSALVVSFVVVLFLGRALATDDPDPAPDSPSGVPVEPTQPHQSSTWLEINVDDPRAGDPAPGILQVHDPDNPNARICIDVGISGHWQPESTEGWETHFQDVCRRLDSLAGGTGTRIRLVKK